jgi:hypothetical protein
MLFCLPALQGLPDSLKQYNALVVTLGQEPVPILGLRVWNYNKNPADTARGVKRCIVLAGAHAVDCGCWLGWAGPRDSMQGHIGW